MLSIATSLVLRRAPAGAPRCPRRYHSAAPPARAALRAAIEALPEQDAARCVTIFTPDVVRSNVTIGGPVLVHKSLLFRVFGLEEEE